MGIRTNDNWVPLALGECRQPASEAFHIGLGRLDGWAMIDDEKEIELSSEAVSSPENEGVTVPEITC
jgi:hypothetical protein